MNAAIRLLLVLPATLAAVITVAACGVETATTAATGAAVKQKEIEQGKKTQDQTREKINQAMDKMQQRSEEPGKADTR